MAELTEGEKNEAIQAAYEKLSDADKIVIDLAVKSLLDYCQELNRQRKMNNHAIFQCSRAMALEVLAGVGILMASGQRLTLD